jgi:hypothetical protein
MRSQFRFRGTRLARLGLVVALVLLPLVGIGPALAAGPTATAPIEASLCPGQSAHYDWTAVIPPAPIKADVLFAFDTTGSMGDVIASAKSNANTITTALAGLLTDVQFGVVDFRDYYPTPAGYGSPGDWPYLLRQPITSNLTALQTAINAMSANGGNDSPESYGRVLYETYADPAVGWRAGARRFVVMFGDQRPHDPDPGRDANLATTGDNLIFANVLAGMNTNGVTLIFVYTGGGAVASVQAGAAGEINPASIFTDWQAWAAATAAGGGAVNLGDASTLPTVIQNAVSSASSFISRLDVRADPAGYQNWFTTSPTAYTNINVPITGFTATFGVDITVPLCTPRGADYNFGLNMVGDGAVYATQPGVIHVSGTCPAGACGPVEVPEGSTLLFLASGLPALWAYARLRARRK